MRRLDTGGGVGREQQAFGDERRGCRLDRGDIGRAAAITLGERGARVARRLALGLGPASGMSEPSRSAMTLFCDGVGSNVPLPTRSIDSGVMRGAITLVPPRASR